MTSHDRSRTIAGDGDDVSDFVASGRCPPLLAPHSPAGRTQLVQAVEDLGRARHPGRDVGAVRALQLCTSLHPAEFPPVPAAIEDRTNSLAPKTRAARLVFTDDKGRPTRRSTWSRVWKVLKSDANKMLDAQFIEAHEKWERLGKPEGAEPERVCVPETCTLHSLRDFYASCLIKKNENVKTVQVRLGHSKPSITLDKYTGLWPTGEDTTADAIESVLGEVPQGPVSEPSALVVPSQPGTQLRSLQ